MFLSIRLNLASRSLGEITLFKSESTSHQAPTMSSQLDRIQSPTPERTESLKEKKFRKEEKKRKRKEQHSEQTSPTKKHRSKKPVDDSAPIEQTSHSKETAETSPFFEQTTSLYLPLSPICQQYPLQGICAEHLSPLLMTFYPPLDGVLLSYTNPKLAERAPGVIDEEEEEPVLAQSVNEYAVSYVWVTAAFLMFRPQRGCRIEGWINLQNEGNIGLVCYNYFSASIEHKRLPKDWRWVGPSRNGPRMKLLKQADSTEESSAETHVAGLGNLDGHFVDGRGKKVGGLLTFTVKDMEASRNADRENAFISIEGTMLSATEEKELRERDFNEANKRSAMRLEASQNVDYTMSGALNGQIDGASDIEPTSKWKHRMAY